MLLSPFGGSLPGDNSLASSERQTPLSKARHLADPDFSEFVPQSKGRKFEDFDLGQDFAHHWGRTLTAADSTLFATLTLAYCPLYTNVEYARSLGHPKAPVHPWLLLCIAVGLSVEDLSEGGGPFLGVNDVVFHKAVYPDDTITAKSTVIGKRESESRPENGIVSWRTEAYNQEGELVLSYERTNLANRRRSRTNASGAKGS